MKRIAHLLLICLVVTLLAASHDAFAARKKAAATPDATQAVATEPAAAQPVAAQPAVTQPATAQTTAPVATTQKTNQVVNINSASAEQLTQVRGIGPKTAKAIIDKRTELGGKFTSIDQLMQVKGIKQKKLDKIKPFLSL
jgi:competence protein ComEA